MTIKILVTGGTFDKEYDAINGRLHFKDTHLYELLDTGRCCLDFEVETILLKDSLEMTDEDLKKIVSGCKRSSQDRIIITHGTDMMVKTAKLLSENIKDKTIVLTGAIIPIRFKNSDGLFNLGCSLAFVQLLPHGIYISMNGRYYKWNRVFKNKQEGRFEEIRTDRPEEPENYLIELDDTNVRNFIRSVKHFAGLRSGDLLSLYDVYSIASHFDLNGVIYLEKNDIHRHVNILLRAGKDSIILYDPVFGLKSRPFDTIQFGMYCKPIGLLKDEFEAYERQFSKEKPKDVWEEYRRRGERLFEFLTHHREFTSMYSKGITDHVRFPRLQKSMNAVDCVPLSLFVISICNSLYLDHHHLGPVKGRGVKDYRFLGRAKALWRRGGKDRNRRADYRRRKAK